MQVSIIKSLAKRFGCVCEFAARRATRIAPVAILAGGLTFCGTTPESPAVELIQNGSFESNDGFNGDNANFSWMNADGVPVFDVYDHSTQVYYEGAAPAGAGNWYFHTVGVSNSQGVFQDVDLTAAAAANVIDEGTVAFDLSAWLAGWTASDDHPDLELQFRDGAGANIGSPVRIDGANFGPGSGFVTTVDGSDPSTAANPIAVWKQYEVLQGVAIGARSARLTILQDSLTANGNDNYVDLVSLDVADTGVEQFMKLRVNTGNGAVTMVNGTADATAINYYEVLSPGGSLSTNGWSSFDDQNLDSLGSDPLQNWTEGGGSGPTQLIEAFPLGTTTFSDNGGIQSLGQAYNANIDARDLEFHYAGTSGQLFRGIVEYFFDDSLVCDFDSSATCDIVDLDLLVAEIVAGTNGGAFDLNGDGVVTLADITDANGWLSLAGAENLGAGRSYLPGDASLDGNVNGQDFVAWNNSKFTATGAWSAGDFNADGNTDGQDFVIWNNFKFMSADGISAVPEPSGSGLVFVFGVAGLAVLRRFV